MTPLGNRSSLGTLCCIKLDGRTNLASGSHRMKWTRFGEASELEDRE